MQELIWGWKLSVIPERHLPEMRGWEAAAEKWLWTAKRCWAKPCRHIERCMEKANLAQEKIQQWMWKLVCCPYSCDWEHIFSCHLHVSTLWWRKVNFHSMLFFFFTISLEYNCSFWVLEIPGLGWGEFLPTLYGSFCYMFKGKTGYAASAFAIWLKQSNRKIASLYLSHPR